LGKFLLRTRDRRQRGIEQHGAGRGSTLIDREKVIRQTRSAMVP
jgi:hypothetical protein